MLSKIIQILFAFCTIVFSQSVETGDAFNKYMSPDGGINHLSGTVSFSVPLATLSAGGVSTSVALSYSGNVSQSVKNRNDISRTGWVGLGWSMGFAKIVSENNHSMSLLDDSYFLITAEGLRYKLIYEGNRWWIEDLPYWLVERHVETKSLNGKTFEIVVGWVLTDDLGNKYQYGDMSYCLTNALDTSCSAQGATAYELGFPAFGHTGESIGGSDIPYPVSWSLAKIYDWKNNALTYSYYQFQEKIKHGSWTSRNGYTKETYLKEVRSSMGSYVKFILSDKNKGDFEGEVVDVVGKEELSADDEIDAFADPLERKFLSKIELYGMDGKILQTVAFCYKALKVSPSLDADENKKYVKRLLTRIVWANGAGKETKRESYEYYDNVYKAYLNDSYALGMMKEIQGANCGKVSFDYVYQAVDKQPLTIHSEKLPVVSVSLGYLEDGTPYLLGIDKNEKKIVVYYWQNGAWNIRRELSSLPYHEDGYFITAKNNWFAYVTGDGDGYDMYPVVWDGASWQVKPCVHDDGDKELVFAGPNYIVKGNLSSTKSTLTLTVPWTLWGGSFVIDTLSADEGSMDNRFLQIYPSENHIAVSYVGTDWGNNYRVRIFSFKYDASGISVQKTYDNGDLDDDNRYYWGNGYLFGAVESTGLWGQRAEAYHWNGSGWTKLLNYDVHGVQGVPRAQAVGYNYVAMRHNDNDDLTLFDWNGESWQIPFENRNMVHHDDFDLLKEAEWDAVGSDNFFVARRPKVDNIIEIPYFCWPKFKRWGIKWKCKYARVWSETHPGANIELFERQNDGGWIRRGEVNTDDSKSEKHLVVGSNWYIEKRSNKAYLWDGVRWNEEKLKINWSYFKDIHNPSGQGPTMAEVFDESYPIGDFFAVEGSAGQPEEGTTTIYYKKNDSFIKNKGVLLVEKKNVRDPIVDKEYSYKYIYNFDKAPDIAFDYVNNTPLITTVRVELPDNSGMIERDLCPIDYSDVGLGLGKICAERTYVGEIVEKSSIFKYTRYRNSSWPNLLHIDAVSSIETYIKGVKSKDSIEYNIALNGQPSRKLFFENGSNEVSSEQVLRYSAEEYAFERSVNHLRNPLLSYSCKPNCSTGKVVESTAARYVAANDSVGTPHLVEEWIYNPDSLVDGNSFQAIPWAIHENPSSIWKKNSSVSKFFNGFAVEKNDALGNKTARVVDDDSIAFERAVVQNAGFDEILVVPGDRCNENGMDVTSDCRLLSLQGRATDGEASTNGRFSKIVIDLRYGFSGVVKRARQGKYRFSAWVQNADNTSASVSLTVNGIQKRNWTLDGNAAGKWHYVEWEGNVESGLLDVSLSSTGNTRVQDIRMIPANAKASVRYYDSHFGTSVVEVDDCGVGKHLALDENGRVERTYGEDASGNLRLLSKVEYGDAKCSDPASGSDVLESLIFDDKPILQSSTDRYLQYVLAGNKEGVAISWNPKNKDDAVRYRLYVDGDGSSTGWHYDCCSANDDIYVTLDGNTSYTLEIDVGSDSRNIYTVHIQKASTGWVRYGNVLRKAEMPLFIDKDDSSKIVYSASDGVYTADFSGNSWIENLVTLQKSKALSGTMSGGNSYLLSMPRILMVDSASNENAELFSGNLGTWTDNGYIFDDSVYGLDFAISTNSSGNVCAAYVKRAAHDSTTPPVLASSCFVNNAWMPIGGYTAFGQDFDAPPAVVPGIIENGDVYGVDMTTGPGGKLYVAYVARNPYFELYKDDVIAEHGDSGSSPKVLIIKRLFDSSESGISDSGSIWAGPTLAKDSASNDMLPNYLGDFVFVDDSIPLAMVKRFKIVGDADYIYLAVAYNVSVDNTGKTAVTVFRGEFVDTEDEDGTPEHRLEFTPYEDASIVNSAGLPVEQERRIIAYLESDAPFDFAVRNGIPYVLFANSQNEDGLTLVSYRNSRWLSVGIPAFIKANKTEKAVNLAFGSKGTPVVVVVQASDKETKSRKKHIVPMKYVATDDVDLTLSGIQVAGAVTTIPSEFRQYLLKYMAKVLSDDSIIEITPALMEPLDVASVQVLHNGTQVSYEGVNFFGALISWVGSIFSPGYNFQDLTSEIHLEPGENHIEINIIGTNGVSLTYLIDLLRENPTTELANTTLRYNVSTNSNLISVGMALDTALYVSRGDSAYRKFCIQFPFGVHLWFKGTTYFRSTCIDLDFTKAPIDTLLLEDENGNKHVIFVEDDNTAEIKKDDEGDGSGEDDEENENIPQPYRTLLGHKVYATGNVTLYDRASISADELVGETVEVCAGASVLAQMTVEGDVLLRSNSNVEDVIMGGNLYMQDGASYGKIEHRDVHIADIPVNYFVTGITDFIAGVNDTVTISSGAYKDFRAYANSEVHFESGEYYFDSFVVEPDVKVYFDGPVRLWVQNAISIADRANLYNSPGGAKNVFLYTNTPALMYFGVSSDFASILVAPYATVSLAPQSRWEGLIWANNIYVQADAVIE